MTGRLFAHRATVKRAVAVGTLGGGEQVTIAENVRCIFIPLSTRVEIEQGWNVGTGYDVYFPLSADIKTGDQLEWDGGTFNVRASRPYNVKRVGHRHVLATREGQ